MRSWNLWDLPKWVQYLISTIVITLVVAAAWVAARNRPTPGWITNILIPVLGWLYLAIVVSLLASKAALLFKREGPR